MSLAEALNKLSGERKKIEENARKAAQKVLTPGLKAFLEEHPSVKAIGWAQYTPYFNDGDTCEFSVGGLNASAVDERDDDLYGDGWTELYGDSEGVFSSKDWKALGKLEEALQGAEDELHAAFGDHVQVIVTSDGVEVTEYEHD